MTRLLRHLMIVLCLTTLATGCATHKKMRAVAEPPRADAVILGYDAAGAPFYGNAPASATVGEDRLMVWTASPSRPS